MPCGTHHFKDFGYERYPYRPLLGEDVSVQLLVEDAVGDVNAVLCWEKDGQRMPEILGEKIDLFGDQRLFFRFSFGSFEELSHVNYRFLVDTGEGIQHSKDYHFEVLQEGPLGPIKQLLQGNDVAYAVFERLIISFTWGDGFCVRILDPTFSLTGEPVGSIHQQLTEEVRFELTAQPFSWSLKRYTKTVLQVHGAEYRVCSNAAGQVQKLTYRPEIDSKHIFGMGERFEGVEQKGNQFVCRVVEHFTKQGKHTYLPIPFFMTETGLGWHSSSRYRTWFDASSGLELSFETPKKGVLLEEHWLFGQPQELLAELHNLTGQAILPPKWAFGLWISGNGWNTQKETKEQLEALKEHDLPATVIVLEAWSDEQTFSIFNDAQYEPLAQEKAYVYPDFTFPADGKWPDPQNLAREIKEAGLNLVLWQIPVVKYEEGGPGPQLQRDETYAIEKGYCVLNDDGTPYRITDHWFKHSLLLDFTNPDAVKWWFSKRVYLLESLGVKGFKTDGGEFLFDDAAILHNGETGETAHNTYTMQYVAAYNDFLKEHGVQGVTFSRAGYTGAQTQPIHWAGDQLSEWSEFQAQVTAGLSAGLSGIPFWSFDISGFAGDFPSSELYLRSVAMAAFCPVMQWHSEPRTGQFYQTDRFHWNNDRSPWNLAFVHQDQRMISIYRLFANLRMNLLPYIYQEAMYCANTARPLMAHMVIDYANDEKAWHIHDQYMFGRDLLVAPVMEEGAEGRKVYLPEGTWHDLFLGESLQGEEVIDYLCPLERIPVFVRDGAVLPVNMNEAGIIGTESTIGGVGNDVTSYIQLGFLCYGAEVFTFTDDIGTHLLLEKGEVSGRGPAQVILIDPTKTQLKSSVQLFGRPVPAHTVAVK